MIFPLLTYFFFELTILAAKALNLHFQLFELVLFLEATLEGTFTVLQKPALPLAQIRGSDFLLNLIDFSRSGALRL